MDGVTLKRNLGPGAYALREVVAGLDQSPALCALFGSDARCRAALDAARVILEDSDGYMWVDDEVGALHVALPWWRDGPELHVYLDLVHELVHVKQFGEGKDLYDARYKYVARPTEIEAYRVAVAEARRVGMPEDELAEYVRVPWVDEADYRELCGAIGVPQRPSEARSAERED